MSRGISGYSPCFLLVLSHYSICQCLVSIIFSEIFEACVHNLHLSFFSFAFFAPGVNFFLFVFVCLLLFFKSEKWLAFVNVYLFSCFMLIIKFIISIILSL